jgi:superfamily I DNA/RNA helicase
MTAMQPKVALSQDFLSNLAKLPQSTQSKVLKWALLFQSDPTARSINYETIHAARDKHLRSVRIDKEWRGIVFKPDHGDVYVLMFVDRHDDAYRWAESRRVAVNPITGALQVFAVESLVESPPEPPRPESSHQRPAAEAPPPLYERLSDTELISLGTPAEMIPRVRATRTEADLDALQPDLPVEAYEGLFLVAAGDSVTEVLTSRETRVDRVINTEDFAAALTTPESQARFVVIDDQEAMAAMLNAPLAQWRVFLHPTQRTLASANRSGPVRVLGGAGTGKTVLAMHRAKWLAEHATPDGQKVFFTTFTRNLALDIQENLKTLCPPALTAKIHVQNLDAWVYGFLRRAQCDYTIVYDRHAGPAAEAWSLAMSQADTSLGLPADFYQSEFDQVVLPQGVTTLDEYRQAKRTGRGTVLTRKKRDAIWPVFEEYRTGLTLRKLKEVDDAYRDAASLIPNHPIAFSSIVVDETQDFGAQALRLLRAMVPTQANDLFFVGDGHQRIYPRNRASMSACGIDIRGRSRKLYLNYRTTEEIRRAAVALLEGVEVDDLDEGSDEIRKYKSVSRGPAPRTLAVTNKDAAYAQITELVAEAVQAPRSICVMVPSKNEAESLRKFLQQHNHPASIIGPNDPDQADSTAARIATMHRAKGLEFDEIVLLVPQRSTANAENQQRLEYVAVTRAKKFATILRIASKPT